MRNTAPRGAINRNSGAFARYADLFSVRAKHSSELRFDAREGNAVAFNIVMKNVTPTCKRLRVASLLAMLTICAMLIAPVCGTLCSGMICAGGGTMISSSSGDCHHMGSDDRDSSSETISAVARSCSLSEFPLAILSAGVNFTASRQTAGIATSAVARNASSKRFYFRSGSGSALFRSDGVAAKSELSVQTVVLRI